jgi:uncharacterized membrane protein
MKNNNERQIDEAIIGGIIGLAFSFIGLKEIGAITNEASLIFLSLLVISFTGVGLFRVYGIILKQPLLKWLSEFIFKIIVVPLTPYCIFGALFFQLPPSLFSVIILLTGSVISILIELLILKKTLKEPLPDFLHKPLKRAKK